MVTLNPKISMTIGRMAVVTLRIFLCAALVLGMSPGLDRRGLSLKPQEAQAQTSLDLSKMAPHPRIILTPERLITLRARFAANDPYWLAFKGQCDYLLTLAADGLNTVYCAEPLALCYQITLDPKYAEKAISFMKSYAQWLDSNFDFASDWNSFPRSPGIVFDETDYGNMHMTSVAIAYDWIYDKINPVDREYFSNIFNKCIDSAMVRKGIGYGVPVSNHSHTKNRTELYLGLASYGDNYRAEEFINTAYGYFTDKLMSLYNRYNIGGQIYMGTAYGYRRTLPYALFCVDALKTALSIDLYNQNPWLEDVIDYIIYAQAPKGGTTYVFGQSGVGTQMGFSDVRNLQFMFFLRAQYSGNTSGAYLESFMSETGKNTIDTRVNSIDVTLQTEYQLLFRDKSITPKDYRLDFPKAYLSSGLGLFLARSDWSQDALWFSLQGGDYVGDHQYFDMGHFTVFRGSRLVSNAGINRIVIGQYGSRQDLSYLVPAGFSPTGSQVENFENTDDFAYAKLNLTRTYYGPEFHGQALRSKILNQEVSKTTRQAVMLRPDYVLLYDRTGTVNEAIPTTWVVSSDSPTINVSGNDYSWTRGNNTIYVRTVLPQNINVSTEVVATNFGKLKVRPQVPIMNERYLHIFYAPLADTSLPSSELLSSFTDNVVVTKIGNQVVAFAKHDPGIGLNEAITYNVSGAGLSNHLIVDLEPNIGFKVEAKSNDNGQVITSRALTSSANGTIYFTIGLTGNTEVAITSQGVQPSVVYGDVSGDGKVSMYDAALAAQHAIGLITLTAEQLERADVSGDGQVSMYDAALIAQRALGLIARFPVE